MTGQRQGATLGAAALTRRARCRLRATASPWLFEGRPDLRRHVAAERTVRILDQPHVKHLGVLPCCFLSDTCRSCVGVGDPSCGESTMTPVVLSKPEFRGLCQDVSEPPISGPPSDLGMMYIPDQDRLVCC